MKFEKRTFQNETVTLDFNEFVGCSFKGCALLYHGHTGLSLNGCNLADSQLLFAGPAGMTLNVLAAMYADPGMRALADAILNDVRTNRVRTPASH